MQQLFLYTTAWWILDITVMLTVKVSRNIGWILQLKVVTLKSQQQFNLLSDMVCTFITLLFVIGQSFEIESYIFIPLLPHKQIEIHKKFFIFYSGGISDFHISLDLR